MTKWFVLLSLVMAFPSYAVRTKDCPEKLTFEFEFEKVISADTLKKQLSVSDQEDGSIEKSRQQLAALAKQKVELTLIKPKPTRTRKSICLYHSDDDATARFYTSKGKDIFRVDISEPNDSHFGIYVTVVKYGPDRFEIKTTSSGVAYEAESSDGGFALIWMAKAKTKVE